MTYQPVEAVWAWRFSVAPFKATYGRISGSTTYSKDFLQASSDCARALDDVFNRQSGQTIDFRFTWPGGEREGKLFEAADYASNGRLNLRWETDNAPDPWKLVPAGDPSPLKTLIGDPTHTTQAAADNEFEQLKATGVDPWLVVVKLHGESDRLHVRAYLEKPPNELAHTSTALLPSVVRTAMASVSSGGGCAVARIAPGATVRAPKIVSQVVAALERGPNVLLVGPPGTGKTVALEDLRNLFETGSATVLFDPSLIHDAWSESAQLPTGKVRTIAFHPSYSYEEFVIGLYPMPASGGSGVELEPRPGPLLSLAHWASEAPRAALLLIDEFNRGNAAAIFGDALALLDKGKRRGDSIGQAGATIDRPYSGLAVDVAAEFATSAGTSVPEQLHLPSVLWIVAAMNSSDRSVAPLDAALRRRFSIVRVEPDYDALAMRLGIAPRQSLVPTGDPAGWSPSDIAHLAVALMRRLNERIEAVLGADFLLGHALLWDVGGTDTPSAVASLCAAFDENIVSTLRMTFADQDEPLGAILGAGPPPPPGGSSGGSPIAHWLSPSAELEAVAPPRLRIRLTQDLPWPDAADSLRSLL